MNGLHILAILFFSNIAKAEPYVNWSYTGTSADPSKWGQFFTTCLGAMQSPIRLSYLQSIYDPSLPAISICQNPNAKTDENFTIANTGRTLEITFPDDYFYLKLGEHQPEFMIVKIQFHWGRSNIKGSEHSFEGKKLPLEMQLISYNKDYYDNFTAAVNAVDGLAIVAALFIENDEISIKDTLLYKMSNFLVDSCYLFPEETPLALKPFSVDVFQSLKEGFSKYYRYQGSLTSPPCTENVYWTILATKVAAHHDQLNAFRCMRYGIYDNNKAMLNNFRPEQPLNSILSVVPRSVYRSWDFAKKITYSTGLTNLLSAISLLYRFKH